jgi:two-component system, probable response regulator PhcQ
MTDLYDYKKFAILYVDDEEKSLKYFQRVLGNNFRIFIATNARDGFRIFEEHQDEIGILLTDQRMPGEKGVQLLEKVRTIRPNAIRILVTAYSDFDAAIDAVNTGAIYKYISKPWDVADLEITLRRAMEFFLVHNDREHLMRQKFTALHKTLVLDRVVGLTVLASGISHLYRNTVDAARCFMELDSLNPTIEDLQMAELNNPNLYRKLYMQTREQIRRVIDVLQLEEFAVKHGPNAEISTTIESDSSLKKAVDSYITQFEQKNIAINIPSCDSIPAIYSEPLRFQKLHDLIVQNLLLYVPEDSAVRITIQTHGNTSCGSHLKICVEDNAEKTPISGTRAIIDPFFTSDALMHDLGLNLLAICVLTYHLGGSISYESMEGEYHNRLQIQLPLKLQYVTERATEIAAVEKALINEPLWETVISQMEK